MGFVSILDDLRRAVETLRRARPDVRFSLEMIVRDPLRVPCLTDEFWASFDEVNGRDLARADGARVRAGRSVYPICGE